LGSTARPTDLLFSLSSNSPTTWKGRRSSWTSPWNRPSHVVDNGTDPEPPNVSDSSTLSRLVRWTSAENCWAPIGRTHQIRIVARTSTAGWCDVTVKARNVLVSVGRRCAQRLVKSCAGVVRLASTWNAGLVSVAEAKQLSFFRADDYEVTPPSHADGLLAFLGIRRPVCRCGDPYQSHQHYRKGADCSVCRCERYGPVLFKPRPRGERSVRLLRQLRLS
jgi:hypothetical protein